MHPTTTELTATTRSQEVGLQTTPVQVDTDSVATTNYAVLTDDHAIDFNNMQDSMLSDYADLGQFAAIFSSGLGNLDAFISDDPFKF